MIHNKTKKKKYQTKRSELTKTLKPFIYGFNKVSIFKHIIDQRKIENIKKNHKHKSPSGQIASNKNSYSNLKANPDNKNISKTKVKSLNQKVLKRQRPMFLFWVMKKRDI